VYNTVPPAGVSAEFAFNLLSVIVHIDSSVVADPSAPGGYRIETTIRDISQGVSIGDTTLTLWGSPSSSAHDLERTAKGAFSAGGEAVPSDVSTPRALMTNPTACDGSALSVSARLDSWQAPGAFSSGSYDHDPAGNPFVITGCDKVPFEPTLEARPTTTQADSPTGLDVNLVLPQNELPEGIASAGLRDAVVTLPEGMAVNPSSAGGLGSCSEGQIGLGDGSSPTCPANSKIGTVQIDTPLLAKPLEGGVYLAQQGQNKFGSLLALYLVVDDPTTGVLLKIPGKVETDPTSGRVVTRFTDAPQLPMRSLKLHLDGGPRASLVTPPTCGTYTSTGEFTPWTGGGTVVSSSSFKISQGPAGAACPSGFDPELRVETADPSAGTYSPFELRISRPDGSDRLSKVSVRLPKGLLGKLAGIPYCADAALAGIPTGEGTGGAQLASPSCPAASRVGSVAVAAGAGLSPFWEKTGSAYLAGPYKGAPLSLAVVTPVVAGPFDLGNVVVRVALAVDPETAQVSADSDPLPTILSGIPLDLREVRVALDRKGFMLNPTSCASQRTTSSLTAAGGATASPSAWFAPASCDRLGFAPKLRLALKGGTRRGAHPRLTAKVRARPGQANLARVAVALPHTEFLAQNHIRTVCTRVQFAADRCPAGSIYGWAEARTPLLDAPLRGPVYLRSSSHKLPDLVAALHGQIEIDLDGRIDSHHRGIRTTFATIPDAPIESFVLRMKGGKKSLLENSTSLCGRAAGKAQVSMRGQNGAKHNTATRLAARCGKGKKHR
jgi:hypothetical protein